MKNNFPKMKTPKFRHPNTNGVTIKKHHRKRYAALCYFAGIAKQHNWWDLPVFL